MVKRAKKPKNVLKLPDLDYSRSAVLNSLPSLYSRRSYDHAIRDLIEWYCSEPRLAFNKTVVTRYRIALGSGATRLQRSIPGSLPFAGLHSRLRIADCLALTLLPAFAGSKERSAWAFALGIG